jgi:hypothetical protein
MHYIDEYPQMNIHDLASLIHRMRKEGLVIEVTDTMGETWELADMFVSPGHIRFDVQEDTR